MKIAVTDREQKIRLAFPTRLLFSKSSSRMAEWMGRKYAPEAMEKIPPGTLVALCREICNLKKKHGPLELIEVEGADGTYVKIVL